MIYKVEFHCHTRYSKDSLTSPEELLKARERKGLDRVVITDHNTIRGALHARELDPEHVIVGEEIMTQQGEILAAFVQEEIPACLPAKLVIAALREQGAFISVSHPFDRMRSGSWALPDLIEIAPLVDAIEVFNARCMLPAANRKALEFAQQHGLPGTAGSDAHHTYELGRAWLAVPAFSSAEELRQAIASGRVEGKASAPWVHLFSRYATWRKQREAVSSR